MEHERYNYSTLISLALHILMLWVAFTWHSAHILVPSRSDGIEVSLVSRAEVIPVTAKVSQAQNEPSKTLSRPAEINLKQITNSLPPKANKLVPPKVTPPVRPFKPTSQAKPEKKSSTLKSQPKAQLNDLLSQLDVPPQPGKSKGSAIGGTAAGTSNSNNLTTNYADRVIERVRPYISLPTNLSRQATAVVQVILLPNMQVYQVTLVKSSGNDEYDANVQQAIHRVKIFPPLPKGAQWTDYRQLNLTFRPE